MTEDESYELRYSWPFRLIGPVFLGLAVAFPLLVHSVSPKEFTLGEWVGSIALLGFGIGCGNYYSRRVGVTSSGVVSRRWLGSRELAWDSVERAWLDGAKGEFVMQAQSGRPLRVDIHLLNAGRLRQDLQQRFGSGDARVPG